MQLMSAQFLPSSTPFSGAPVASNMNFSNASMQPSTFQNQIQNLSQQQQGSREPNIPWALSKEEKKSYDAIFRAWDQSGSGFVSGDVAREVFGQSGLDRDGLMQIWHLSDTENRGKLNLAEFHVAMGLIYRALNGNDIPNELPQELIPPSSRQLSETVDFVKDLLKRDTAVRNTTALNLPESGSNRDAQYTKSRSLYQNPVERRSDAAAYKHEDSAETGGYRSSSRHLDRKAVRWGGESKGDDLSEMKRQLANTQKMLEDQDGEDDSDDREIAKEMDDLRYRISRVQDDIEYYNRRGGRDAADQRRKAERELMHLTHERLPQLEKRMEENEKRKHSRKLDQSRDRDRRNESFGRSSPYSSSTRYDDRDRPKGDTRGEYLKGSFEKDERGRGQGVSRDRSRDRSRERYGDDRASTPRARSPSRDGSQKPATNAPSAPVPASPAPAPAASVAPAASSGPPKGMTAEERQAWVKSEAQRRIQERMRALGASAPSSPGLDTSVEDRLKADREEAAARAAQADQEAAARDEARRARLEEQKLSKDKAAVSAVKAEINQDAKGPDAPPQAVTEEARKQVDDQEEMIRRREEVLAKEKAEREARFKKLQEEEEEARRQEEAFKERQAQFSGTKSQTTSSLPPPSRKKGGPPPPPPTRSRAPPAPAAPPAPPAALSPPTAPVPPPQTSPTNSTNPFHRMQAGGATNAAATPSSTGGTNPFFRQQQAAAGSAQTPPAANASLPPPSRPTPPVSAQPTGAASRSVSAAATRAPAADDDWGDSDKSEDEEDDDGPGTTTRATRQNLAQALFSGMVPSGGGDSGSGRSTPSAPRAPTAADAPPPPPPPGAPSAPAPPSAPAAAPFKPPAAPVDRGALLSQIQGGARLKKAAIRDASGPPGAGKVIGDASAPVQTYAPPPSPPAPPAEEPSANADESFAAKNPNRESVDWANSLAADQMNGHKASVVPDEPSVVEEAESEDDEPEDVDGPSLLKREAPQVDATSGFNGHTTRTDSAAAIAGDAIGTANEDFDLSVTFRVRTLYPYSGQREEDLSFNENEIVIAHPGKDGSNDDWLYGTLLTGATGSKGQFPRAYAAEINSSE